MARMTDHDYSLLRNLYSFAMVYLRLHIPVSSSHSVDQGGPESNFRGHLKIKLGLYLIKSAHEHFIFGRTSKSVGIASVCVSDVFVSYAYFIFNQQ